MVPVVMGQNEVAKLITAESTMAIPLPQKISEGLSFKLDLIIKRNTRYPAIRQASICFDTVSILDNPIFPAADFPTIAPNQFVHVDSLHRTRLRNQFK